MFFRVLGISIQSLPLSHLLANKIGKIEKRYKLFEFFQRVKLYILILTESSYDFYKEIVNSSGLNVISPSTIISIICENTEPAFSKKESRLCLNIDKRIPV